MDQTLLDTIREKVLPLITAKELELVDLFTVRERGRFILRFLVDRAGGITLDQCAQLNQEIGELLDTDDLLRQSYVLEVSSPGLDRPLKSRQDFKRHLGELVRIALHQPLKGQNVWLGHLDQVDDEDVVVQTENQQRVRIPRNSIARARLEVHP